MLNKKKIRWMTRASIYEKREGKHDMKMNRYFLSDYVRLNVLINFVGVTIAYLILAGLYLLYKVEDVFRLITEMKIESLIKEIIVVYVIVLIVYTGFSILFYAWRYHVSSKRIKKYYRMLKLIDKYGQEDRR